MTSLFEQIIATRTSNNPASEQFLGHSKDLTRMWTRRIAYPLTSWSQALDDYRNRSESEISYWPDQDVFYPLPIAALAEGSNPETKDLFKNDALEALRKWRTPGTALPRIYPAKKDWQEGIAFHLLKQADHNPLALWEPLTFSSRTPPPLQTPQHPA